jgi:hypothetical protein
MKIFPAGKQNPRVAAKTPFAPLGRSERATHWWTCSGDIIAWSVFQHVIDERESKLESASGVESQRDRGARDA